MRTTQRERVLHMRPSAHTKEGASQASLRATRFQSLTRECAALWGPARAPIRPSRRQRARDATSQHMTRRTTSHLQPSTGASAPLECRATTLEGAERIARSGPLRYVEGGEGEHGDAQPIVGRELDGNAGDKQQDDLSPLPAMITGEPAGERRCWDTKHEHKSERGPQRHASAIGCIVRHGTAAMAAAGRPG